MKIFYFKNYLFLPILIFSYLITHNTLIHTSEVSPQTVTSLPVNWTEFIKGNLKDFYRLGNDIHINCYTHFNIEDKSNIPLEHTIVTEIPGIYAIKLAFDNSNIFISEYIPTGHFTSAFLSKKLLGVVYTINPLEKPNALSIFKEKVLNNRSLNQIPNNPNLLPWVVKRKELITKALGLYFHLSSRIAEDILKKPQQADAIASRQKEIINLALNDPIFKEKEDQLYKFITNFEPQPLPNFLPSSFAFLHKKSFLPIAFVSVATLLLIATLIKYRHNLAPFIPGFLSHQHK